VPVGVHAGGQQGVHVDDPTTLADLEHEGVGGQERVGAGVQGPVPEVCDLASRSLAISLTWDFDSRVIPRDSTSFSIRRVETPRR
jgi:hypothetical protein